jgi:hypothetical protein
VEASWSIYANHGGGYSYRLCKSNTGDGTDVTEACFQEMPLDFATDTTEVRYVDGSRPSLMINATTTAKGTFPKGSQWRKNPIPMCNCDIGGYCTSPKEVEVETRGQALNSHAMKWLQEAATDEAAEKEAMELEAGRTAGKKSCTTVPQENCGTTTGKNTCLKCGTNAACTWCLRCRGRGRC